MLCLHLETSIVIFLTSYTDNLMWNLLSNLKIIKSNHWGVVQRRNWSPGRKWSSDWKWSPDRKWSPTAYDPQTGKKSPNWTAKTPQMIPDVDRKSSRWKTGMPWSLVEFDDDDSFIYWFILFSSSKDNKYKEKMLKT